MVHGVRINAGTHHFAQHAHVLSRVRDDQHRDQWMQQHSLRHQRCFDGVSSSLLIKPANPHLVDHGQRNRA